MFFPKITYFILRGLFLRVIYYVCVCVFVFVRVFMHIYIYIHGCVNVFMYEVYMYVCMHVCVMSHQVCGQRVVMAKS